MSNVIKHPIVFEHSLHKKEKKGIYNSLVLKPLYNRRILIITPNRTKTNPMPGVANESNAAQMTKTINPAEMERNLDRTTPDDFNPFNKNPTPSKIAAEIKKTIIK